MPERLTWEQMAEKYPDKWLALCNCKYDENNDATIIEADILKVFNSWDDYYTFRDNNIGKGYRYEYTTEPTMSGVQYGTNFTVKLG